MESTATQTQQEDQGAEVWAFWRRQASRVEQMDLQVWQTGSLEEGKGTRRGEGKGGGEKRRWLTVGRGREGGGGGEEDRREEEDLEEEEEEERERDGAGSFVFLDAWMALR